MTATQLGLDFLPALLPDEARVLFAPDQPAAADDVVARIGYRRRAPSGWRVLSQHLLLPRGGRPRWVMPASAPLLFHALRSYRPSRRWAQAALQGVRLLAASGVVDPLLWRRVTVMRRVGHHASAGVLCDQLRRRLPLAASWAASLGTPGPFRKTSLRVMDDRGRALAQAKLGRVGQPGERVKAEAHALAQLAQLPLRRVRVPRLLFHGGHRDHCWLVQQHLGDGAPRRQPSVRQICDFHVELQGFTGRPAPLQSGAFWRRVASRLDTLPHSAAAEGWRRGCCAVAGRTLRLGVMHGDLAPWNVMVTTNGQLAVFDWETFCAGAPPLLDVIHWLLFRPMLLQQRSPDALFAAVVHGIEGQHLRSVASRLQCDLPLPSLLVLYVVDWITRLEVEQQGKWQPSRARMIARLGRILRAALVVGGMRC